MDKELEQQIAAFMSEELAKGTSLSQLHGMVNEKFQTHLTYMEIRIIASELQVDWNANDPKAIAAAKEKAKKEEEARAAEAEAAMAAENGEAPAGDAPGKCVVTVNKVNPPGILASGTVTFSSGSTADWYVDQTGRPGIGNLKGEQPTQQEAEEFMVELQKVLR
ncbi:MAG: hypothetical protein IKB99_04660 [Lentisphaeria bacterium]|nr:hypothetical protein [Lentisphaeria bacterium]